MWFRALTCSIRTYTDQNPRLLLRYEHTAMVESTDYEPTAENQQVSLFLPTKRYEGGDDGDDQGTTICLADGRHVTLMRKTI